MPPRKKNADPRPKNRSSKVVREFFSYLVKAHFQNNRSVSKNGVLVEWKNGTQNFDFLAEKTFNIIDFLLFILAGRTAAHFLSIFMGIFCLIFNDLTFKIAFLRVLCKDIFLT